MNERMSNFLGTDAGQELIGHIRLFLRDLGDQILARALPPDALRAYAEVVDKRR